MYSEFVKSRAEKLEDSYELSQKHPSHVRIVTAKQKAAYFSELIK